MKPLGLAHFKLIENPYMVDIIDHGPKRPHRKKRIAKKWLKRYGRNIEYRPQDDLMVMGDTIIGHPATIYKLRMGIA